MGILRPNVTAETVETDVSYPIGTAGTVAIIGNFEKAEHGVIYDFFGVRQALRALGENENYSGTECIKQVFKSDQENDSNGANHIMVYQLGTRQKANLTLNNIITLEADKGGKYGNNFTITVIPHQIEEVTLNYDIIIKYNNEIIDHIKKIQLNDIVNRINLQTPGINAQLLSPEVPETEEPQNETELTLTEDQPFTGGEESENFTIEDINKALFDLKGEKFDYFISTEILDMETIYPIISKWTDIKFKNDKPTTAVLPLTSETRAGNIAITNIANSKNIIYLSQTFNNYSLAPSVARWVGFIAGLPVNVSGTNKIVGDIETIYPLYNDDDGDELIEAGITIFEQKNRQNNKYGCVSSVTCEKETYSNGDLKIYSEQYITNILHYLTYYFDLSDWLGNTLILADLTSANGQLLNRADALLSAKIVTNVDVNATPDEDDPFMLNVDFDAKVPRIVKGIRKRIKVAL
ncbi:hypothetical protein [Methanobrevibacter filiformis]|uniref:Phage tail sheath protein n=1 Tax=Methanobrevibacter filiformis TaxID=55758 RepID=A0A166FAK1_9EURY|nr:hypothetical protein [Methanobrevibacter filiformis]KZX17471.1 phage tail sheath protein [Methanobrevibacter filiformis]